MGHVKTGILSAVQIHSVEQMPIRVHHTAKATKYTRITSHIPVTTREHQAHTVLRQHNLS